MSKEFYVIAIIYPKKGKADRVRMPEQAHHIGRLLTSLQVVELIQNVSKYVKDNEPGTLRYEITRDLKPGKDGNEDVVMIERYTMAAPGPPRGSETDLHRYSDHGALKAHGTSKPFVAFGKQLGEEGLIRAPMTLKMVSERGGFASRL